MFSCFASRQSVTFSQRHGSLTYFCACPHEQDNVSDHWHHLEHFCHTHVKYDYHTFGDMNRSTSRGTHVLRTDVLSLSATSLLADGSGILRILWKTHTENHACPLTVERRSGNHKCRYPLCRHAFSCSCLNLCCRNIVLEWGIDASFIARGGVK